MSDRRAGAHKCHSYQDDLVVNRHRCFIVTGANSDAEHSSHSLSNMRSLGPGSGIQASADSCGYAESAHTGDKKFMCDSTGNVRLVQNVTTRQQVSFLNERSSVQKKKKVWAQCGRITTPAGLDTKQAGYRQTLSCNRHNCYVFQPDFGA